MKILHLNTSDTGGAATACVRLHKELRNSTDSKLLVGRQARPVPDSFSVDGKLNKIRQILAPFFDLAPELFFRPEQKIPRSYGHFPTGIPAQIKKMRPDLLHLHWIGGGLLRFEALTRLNLPTVWTLHDLWPISGSEHFTPNLNRTTEGYNKKNRPEKETGIDIDRWVWKRKKRSLSKIKKLAFIAPSQYVYDIANRSLIARDRKIRVIPNGLDTATFRPIDQLIARNILLLDPKKKLVLFGAYGALSDERKGFALLREAINQLSRKIDLSDTELVVFGAHDLGKTSNLHLPVHFLGEIADETTLALLYAACDLTVVPSYLESFGQVAAESLACGTPVACFETSGLTDIVEHQKNGYMAKCFDTNDLAQGLGWLLSDKTRRQFLGDNGRKKALAKFDIIKVAKQHLELYEEMINS